MIPIEKKLNLKTLLVSNWRAVSVTWLLVLLENVLMALLPLLIGFSIDDLLAGQSHSLQWLALVMVLLTLIAVGRRIYDTRVYGSIRVEFGLALEQRSVNKQVSLRNARLDMSRELVDFLEKTVPELITGITQITIALIILANFNLLLALTAVVMGILMLFLYSQFHAVFLRLNMALNNQTERQVGVLSLDKRTLLNRHLKLLRLWEVKLSDREAILYGLIFLLISGFVIANLWLATQLSTLTAGTIFSVVTYSLEYVEAALILPATLQGLTRLQEITQRINAT